MRQRYHGRRSAFPALLAGMLMVWAVTWWRRRRPFAVAVDGASMLPALREGDFLVAVRARPDGLRLGDLVVVEHPERLGFELVKRLRGVPGQTVDGRRLGPGEFWVLGDHPAASTDSRSLGPVGFESIRGVVRLRYWPPSRLGPIR